MTNKYNTEQNKITKESIFGALMSLMEKKDFKNISITEVTQKAGVSRMAFYRNYSIMEDILIDHLDDMFREYSNLLNHKEISNYEMTRLYFYYFRQHQKFIENLLRSKLAHLILERTVEFLNILSTAVTCTMDCSPEFEKYNIAFLAGGFFNVLITWCKSGMNESDEKMAEMVYERLSNHIAGISSIE
jgi:AcrR family transcriptional regulator